MTKILVRGLMGVLKIISLPIHSPLLSLSLHFFDQFYLQYLYLPLNGTKEITTFCRH
jgi:hypothetical protein